MLLFILLASYIVWYVVDHNYAGQLAEKDAAIASLTAQISQLKQEIAKTNPQSPVLQPPKAPKVDSSSFIDNIQQNAQEGLSGLSNDINNTVNDTVNDIQNETNNATANINNSVHQSVRNTRNSARNKVDSYR